jgi:hypothetical protein
VFSSRFARRFRSWIDRKKLLFELSRPTILLSLLLLAHKYWL